MMQLNDLSPPPRCSPAPPAYTSISLPTESYGPQAAALAQPAPQPQPTYRPQTASQRQTVSQRQNASQRQTPSPTPSARSYRASTCCCDFIFVFLVLAIPLISLTINFSLAVYLHQSETIGPDKKDCKALEGYGGARLLIVNAVLAAAWLFGAWRALKKDWTW